MSNLNKKAIQTALDAFRQKLPTPDRGAAIELLRLCGFVYKTSSERVDIYKSSQFPGRLVTINKGMHIHEGMAQAIASTVEQLMRMIPEDANGGNQDDSKA